MTTREKATRKKKESRSRVYSLMVAWGPGRRSFLRLRASWIIRGIGEGLAAATTATATGRMTAQGRGHRSTDGFFGWGWITTGGGGQATAPMKPDGPAGWGPHADRGLGRRRGCINVSDIPGCVSRFLWRMGSRWGGRTRSGIGSWSKHLLHQVLHLSSLSVGKQVAAELGRRDSGGSISATPRCRHTCSSCSEGGTVFAGHQRVGRSHPRADHWAVAAGRRRRRLGPTAQGGDRGGCEGERGVKGRDSNTAR